MASHRESTLTERNLYRKTYNILQKRNDILVRARLNKKDQDT